MPGPVYGFDRFRLDAGAHVLFRDDERIPLTPKAVDLLIALLENRGSAVGREELFARVWPGTAVEDGTLSSHVSLLRKAVGSRFIETIPKRGYRFVGEVAEAQPAASRVLLAVLPFENLSGNKKYDWFSDGLTEELITQLARMNPARLGVIARTSAMAYRSTEKTIEQIGRELGVDYVVEGSARRAGDRVRIAVQLIQVSDQTHVWADTYEFELADILAVQSRVAGDVARQTKVRLLGGDEQVPRRVQPAAYEAYLMGRYLWNRRSRKDLEMSTRSFREAIELDPGYSSAHAGLADVYLTLMDNGYMREAQAIAKARTAIDRALAIDDSLAEAHVSRGHAALHELDWPAAQRELQLGIALNPSYSNARYYYSNYLLSMARMDEALEEARQAMHLDPVSPAVHSNLASVLWFAGDSETSIVHARRSLDLNPSFFRAFEDLGRAYEQMGELDEAIEMFEKAVVSGPGSDGSLASLGYCLALAGRRRESKAIVRKLREKSKTTFVSAYSFALLSLGLGETEEMFAHLDEAYACRSSALPFIGVNPRFRSVRGEARFRKLVRRLGVGVAPLR